MNIVRAFRKSPGEAPQREQQRLAALAELDVLDTARDPGFDRLVRLIMDIFSVEIGLVSFMDAHRQWYKACTGLPVDEMPRRDTFCRYVLDTDECLIVENTMLDPRFASHPSVIGPPGIRFYAGVPLRTADGHVIGTICALDNKPRLFSERDLRILEEIAAAAMDRVELLQLASTDSLTGGLTRRAFRQDAARLLSEAARNHHDMACIALDIDHFKAINDTYGHAAGDEVLKQVAATCRENLRTGDLLARLGGEEFAFLLPGLDRCAALAEAEKIRHALSLLEIPFEGHHLKVTGSFGVTAASVTAGDIDTLLAQADAAMYQAKQGGRNRCMPWGAADGDEIGERRRVLQAGRIMLGDGHPAHDCTIRSLGPGGASLTLSNAAIIPREFQLALEPDGPAMACRVIARNRQNLEVSFR